MDVGGKSYLESASGAFSYMAYGNIQQHEPIAKKTEESIYNIQERPVDLSGVTLFA